MYALTALLMSLVNFSKRDGEDAALFQRIASGEEMALSELYDRYAGLLYGFAVKMLKSVEDSQDIIQEVFLQVWNKAASYQSSKGSVYTWLVTMTRNRVIDRIRSKGFKRLSMNFDISSLSLAADPRSSDPHTKTVAAEYRQLVAGALGRLQESEQQVLALAYYEGYSQSEIAEKLSIPLGTVKSRMRKGMISMRSWLEGKI